MPVSKRDYKVYKGDKVEIKAWVNGVPIESAALDQLKKTASLPFIHSHLAVMPDVHFGRGSTVGSVIPTLGAIIPAAVGVDIGCCDRDTEFLSPSGWKKISDWDEDQVMSYDPATGAGKFVLPEYIVLPGEEFFHLKTKYGIDQMLCPDHRILFYRGGRKRDFENWDVISAIELVESHEARVQGFGGRINTTFTPNINTRVDITDEALRVMVMVMADTHFPKRSSTRTCILKLRKGRKIRRAECLLESAGIHFLRSTTREGDEVFRFLAPRREKSYGWLWKADLEQLRIITEEVVHWDGSLTERCFYSRDKVSADFIQYAFTAVGYRSVLRADNKDGSVDFRVFFHTNTKVGIKSVPKTPIARVSSVDGKRYCFRVPSGFWVMRRGGNIAMTGNCGMVAVRTGLVSHDLPTNLKRWRASIEKVVPVGGGKKGSHSKGCFSSSDLPKANSRLWANKLEARYDDILAKHKSVKGTNSFNQLGTLGGGNHFIEICLAQDDRVWLMLHSGSRGVGNGIGRYFTDLAKEEMETLGVKLPDKDLAYLQEGTQYFDDYIEAMQWAQDFAQYNRDLMVAQVFDALRRERGVPQKKLLTHDIAVNAHHNYTTKERHYDEDVWLTRKGAVCARKGVMGIIPGSMGAKSFIVEGKGNPESFNSCSHGAGRLMSRSKAKKTFTLDDHIAATAGVECRKDESVIDETPGAYKSIDDVMKAQSSLVKIKHTLHQVLCVKG